MEPNFEKVFQKMPQLPELQTYLPASLMKKNLPASAGDIGHMGSVPGWGRSPDEGNGNPLQYSCLGNSMDREAWWAVVHVTKELDTT